MSFNILYITHALNGLLMIVMPIGLGFYLTRKYRLSWQLYWVGGAIFILSQVFHIPFNALVSLLFQTGRLPPPSVEWRLAFNSILLGLSAGFFEEFARYLMYRWWTKDARSWSKALLLGAGHGGVEAIVLGILVFISYFIMIAMQGIDLTKIVSGTQLSVAQAQLTAYWSYPWLDSLLGAVERLFTLCVQVSFSVMVLQVFTRKKLYWLFIAITWHASIDAIAVYAASLWGPYVTEALVGGYAIASLVLIYALRQPEMPEVIEEMPPLPPPPTFTPTEIIETEDKIQETRYN